MKPKSVGDKLTILITNIALFTRSGTEVVAEQLSDGLRRRGHKPILFAPLLGNLAAKMRARGHIVVDKPIGLPMRPDVIHGHHTGPVMAAIAANPRVPALFVSHDACAPHDMLPRHPRIRRIFAVDERCRTRLVIEGADPASVQILPNAVDLSRIPSRGPLPARPAKAVAFTKNSSHLQAIRMACSAAGIAFEEYGFGVGKVVDSPEQIFAQADLVFATARTALEASAAGAGVVVCDERGCAGFLTSETAQSWLPYNLGAGILAHPCTDQRVSAAIAEWSAEEAIAASELVRERHGLEAWLDRLEVIYSEIVQESPSYDEAAEAAAVGTFITDWVPHYGQEAPWRRLADLVSSQSLGSPIHALENELNGLGQKINAVSDLPFHTLTLARKIDELRDLPLLTLRLARKIDELKAVHSRPSPSVWLAVRGVYQHVVALRPFMQIKHFLERMRQLLTG
jgi:hypothetical protein